MPDRSKFGTKRFLLCVAAPLPAFIVVLATLIACATALASTIAVKDTARLHLLKASNGTLTEAGKATGTLPGSVQVAVSINGRSASSGFRIWVHGGSIWGRASGHVKIGKGGYESFGGSLIVTGGNGHFARAKGSGGLYGTLNRANDAMTVQVIGHLHT